ncbi:hypothetical protein BB560_004344 [Smittium megazygosporum]|uniref:Retrotransposon gag domain-containing protein n=1 Tax=Smittium megazygosporum TaxID=133381 RepID=A0A2T9Z9P2_9FUNG|nr:hypothetical protein BB560_004344 [Smittium megazygosporum]
MTGAQSYIDPERFLTAFRRIIDAYGLDPSVHWSRLLPLCTTETVIRWVERSIEPTPPWKIMVNQFVSHYGDRFKVQKVTQELLPSKPNNNESLSQFCTRFQLLADKSKFTTPASRINKPATTHNTTTTVMSTRNSNSAQPVSNNIFTGFSTKTVMCNKYHQIGHYANQCNNPKIKFTEVPPEDSGLADIPTTIEPPIKPYTIPVYVNGHKVMAFIGTGVDRTFMSQKFSKLLSLNITEIQGIIHTANSEVHIPRIGTTEEVRIKSQDIDCIHKCEFLLGSNESLIIGRDLIPKLKLDIFGLLFKYPDQDISILEDSDNATDNELKDPAVGEYNYALDKNRRKMLLDIQPLIDINYQLSVNAACLLEEAAVRGYPGMVKHRDNSSSPTKYNV